MRKDFTELVFILDRSGSMSGLESDTIGGFNSMLKEQKSQDGECIVTTVLFDDKYEIIHDRIGIQGIKSITEKEYYVRGMTALLDAVGKTINKVVNVHRNTIPKQRPGKVMFVIITDGMENSSREYGYAKVKQMVEKQTEKYGWEFVFLGANIDAVETAGRFGIKEDRAANYNADAAGTALNYSAVSCAVSEFRSNNSLKSSWKSEIDEDYKKRGRRKQ